MVAFQHLILPPGAFRLVLALMVVVSHLTRFDIGRLAVLLFFFLSGYWTAQIWAAKFAGRDWKAFYASRWLRIAPLYLIAMGAFAVVLGVTPRLENLTLLGVATSDFDPLGISWSLDIELQYYLVAPVVLLALPSLGTRIIAPICLATLSGWALYGATGIMTVFQYLPAFVLGAVALQLRWKPSERVALGSLAAFVSFSGLAALTPFIDKDVADPFDRDIFAFLWMLPLLPYVVATLGVRSSQMDRHVGNVSYPLYLVHFPLIVILTPLAGKLGAAGIAIAVAVLMYAALDRPIDAWRVRLTEGGGRVVA
jgi:peptidoglycan/LPS O-acetylase OafA/YrhL